MSTTVRLLMDYTLSGVPYKSGDLVSIDSTLATSLANGKIVDSTTAAIDRAILEGRNIKSPNSDAIMYNRHNPFPAPIVAFDDQTIGYKNVSGKINVGAKTIKKTNGINIQDFSLGIASLTSSVPGANAVISSVEGGGVKIVQTSGVTINTSIIFNCTPFLLDANTTVNVVFSVNNPSAATFFKTTVTTQASDFASSLAFNGPSMNTISVPIGGGVVLQTSTGTNLSGTQVGTGVVIGTIIDRIKLTLTLCAGAEIVIHDVIINPVVITAIPLVFDGTFLTHFTEIFSYMSKMGMKGTVAVTTGNISKNSTFMTLEHLKEMYDAGWDITNHTLTHRFASRGYGAAPAAAGSVDQLALSQAVTAGNSLVLNGTLAGTTFTEPRCLMFVSSGNDNNKLFTITGTGEHGESQQEIVTGRNAATYLVGNLAWMSVTSIVSTQAVAGTIKVGVTLGYFELYADIAPTKQYLIDNGFTRGLDLYVAPGGDTNLLLERVLKDLGFRANRITTTNLDQPFLAPHPFTISGDGDGIANGASATLIAVKDKAKAQWSSFTFYLHEIVPDSNTTPTSDQSRRADFRLLIDNLAADMKAGNIICPTFSEYVDMCGY